MSNNENGQQLALAPTLTYRGRSVADVLAESSAPAAPAVSGAADSRPA